MFDNVVTCGGGRFYNILDDVLAIFIIFNQFYNELHIKITNAEVQKQLKN